jgi:hypothetical protein
MGIKQLFFEKDVTLAGNPERLVLPANEIYARYFAIQAKPGNTDNIIIGDEDSIVSGVGHTLTPGSIYVVDTDEWDKLKAEIAASEIWIDSVSNGDGVVVSYPYTDDKFLDP